MQKPEEMTTLRLMTEYHKIKHKENPTTEDLTRKKALWSELRIRVNK